MGGELGDIALSIAEQSDRKIDWRSDRMKPPWEKILLGIATQAGAVVKRDNAAAPINALALLGGAICFVAAYYLPSLALPLVVTGIVLFGLAAVAYFVLLFRAPSRLQSEKYQLAHARMQQTLIGKELSRPLMANELSPPISNPALLPPSGLKAEVE